MDTVRYYEGLIKDANEEIQNCEALKSALANLSVAALECAYNLTNTYNSLSVGLSSQEINAGIEKIAERANAIKLLQSDTETGISNVDKRIAELKSNIQSWEAAKQSAWNRYLAWVNSLFQKKKTNSSSDS